MTPAAKLLASQHISAPMGEAVDVEDFITATQRVALGGDHMQRMAGLSRLREPFPPDKIEKLPKPTFKGAWTDKKGRHCDVCHGYHVLDNCIHLDYVGHAQTTDRLLEVDPFWEWEPMAYTDEGTPLFNNGGLWIRLTVCGVTRIGFGDGGSVKETIGDAIRNAAMRFGVALDLWSKADLHAERNLGDGQTSARERRSNRSGGSEVRQGEGAVAAAAPPERPNQAALDALASVCKQHGYSEQYCIDRFAAENDGAWLVNADEDAILAFAEVLIAESTAEPPVDASGSGTGEGGDSAVEENDDAGVGNEGAGQPTDDGIAF